MKFDTDKLYEILAETTVQLRKGGAITERPVGPMTITDVYMMPSANEAPRGLLLVDVHFLIIGVDREKAKARRAELIAILDNWPDQSLASGPSYISVGGTIGDQGAAFQLFALGRALGLWSIITPEETFGMTGEEASRAAGNGYVMITGYRKEAA